MALRAVPPRDARHALALPAYLVALLAHAAVCVARARQALAAVRERGAVEAVGAAVALGAGVALPALAVEVAARRRGGDAARAGKVLLRSRALARQAAGRSRGVAVVAGGAEVAVVASGILTTVLCVIRVIRNL